MNRGEIWLVQLNPSVGSEIGKTRPVVIVSNNAIHVQDKKLIAVENLSAYNCDCRRHH